MKTVGGLDEDRPLALVEKRNNARRLYALNSAALRDGLTPGLALSDARARLPHLVVADADPAADDRALRALASACELYTPLTALDSPHGLMLDVAGCAHLFGGEAALLARVRKDFAAHGFFCRAAIAPSPDAARALARFSSGGVFAGKAVEEAIKNLPLVALECDADNLVALRQTGLRTIGDLVCRPSRLFAARFGADFAHRLNRLLGREDIRLTPLRSPPACVVERHFAEPLAQGDAVFGVLTELILEAAKILEQRGEGVRRFEANFFRADGVVRGLTIETLRPTRDARSLLALFREKLDALADPLDPGFGFDALRLAAPRVEKFSPMQGDFSGDEVLGAEQELSALLDRLTTRFGRHRILHFVQGDSHCPEKESRAVPLDEPASNWPKPAEGEPPARPLTLFEPPQRIEVLALAPDGPPARFFWRRQSHEVLRAEGPERIAPEWSDLCAPTRDYYRVEDAEGRRFWLFRLGVYDADERPRWFLHGLFA